MKGFKDKNNKFHPINNKKGVSRKKRMPAKDMLTPTGGVKVFHTDKFDNEGNRMKRYARSNSSLEKMFEVKTVVREGSSDREFDRFTNSISDFGSGDIASAVEKGQEVGLDGNEVADLARQFADDTGTDLNDVDVVATVYEHILQNARNEIDSVLGFDIMNDITGGTEFYVAGNYLATTYDYSQEAVDQLKDVLKKASKSDLQRLSENIFVRSFLSDVDVFR